MPYVQIQVGHYLQRDPQAEDACRWLCLTPNVFGSCGENPAEMPRALSILNCELHQDTGMEVIERKAIHCWLCDLRTT